MEEWQAGAYSSSQPPSLPDFPLILTSPDSGSHYRLSAEIPAEAQQIAVSAQSADGASLRQVTLLANGQPIAMLTGPPYRALWPMVSGMHVFTAIGVDMQGNELTSNKVTIEVVE